MLRAGRRVGKRRRRTRSQLLAPAGGAWREDQLDPPDPLRPRRWRLARKQARQQGHSLPRHWTREYADYQSVWTKFPHLALALNVLAAGVMVLFFVILPLYISRGKLSNLSCP